MEELTVYVGTPLAAEKHARLSCLAALNERKVAAELRVAIDRHLEAAGEIGKKEVGR